MATNFIPNPSPDLQPYNVPAPAYVSPLQTLAGMGQLRAQGLQNQMGQINLQQAQMDMEDQQKFRQIYANSGGNLDQALKDAASAGVGPRTLMPIAQASLEFKQKLAAADTAQVNLANDRADGLRRLMAPVLAETDPAKQQALWNNYYIPQAVKQGLMEPSDVANHPYVSPNEVKRQALGLEGIKWFTAQGAAQRGEAATTQAATAKERQELEAPGQIAKSSEQMRANAAARLANAQTPEDYDQIRDAYIAGKGPAQDFPPSFRVFDANRQWIPKMQDLITMTGLTPEQRAQLTMKPKAEGGFDVQAIRAAANLYAKQNGIVLDPNKDPLAQLPPEAAPGILNAAKGYAETPDTKAIREATHEMTLARLADLRQQQSSAESYVQAMQQNPDIFHELTPAEKERVAPLWMQRTGTPPPVKLGTQTLDQETAAHKVLGQVADIRSAIADPMIQNRLGAILGRLGEAEMDVGATVGLTPEQAQKAQKLRSDLTYLLMGEGRATFGARIPLQMINLLKKTSPRVTESLPMMQGALDSVVGNANQVITNARQQRFGGKALPGYTDQFQPRAPAAAAAPKTLTRAEVNAYATANGISAQQAAKMYTDRGFTITQ